MKIAIKTHNRVEILRGKTLKTLKANGFSLDEVHLFVSGQEQLEQYSEAFPEISSRIVLCPKPGVKGAVNHIQKHFPAGQRVLHMDDDIERFETLNKFDGTLKERKFVEFTELNSLADSGFKMCESNGGTIWGIYPVRHRYMLSEKTTTDLKFIWAGCYGFISQGQTAEDVEVAIKDDFERTLRSYVRCGAVIRFNHVVAKTKFVGAKGGSHSDAENPAAVLHRQDAILLKRKYPGYVSLVKKKSFGGLDVRLRSNGKVSHQDQLQSSLL